MGTGSFCALSLILFGLAKLPVPSDRAEQAGSVATLTEYLELRASRHQASPPALSGGFPPMTTERIGARGLRLLFPLAAGTGQLQLHPAIGPWRAPHSAPNIGPLGARHAAGVPWGSGDPDVRPLLVMGGGALARLAPFNATPGDPHPNPVAGDLAARLYEALPTRPAGRRALDACLPGQSPLGHLGIIEHFGRDRLGDVVSVWDLNRDLLQTDLARRTQGLATPGGPVDELVKLLAAQPPLLSDVLALQESWFASHPEARASVERVLITVGAEYRRRLWLHGARELVVVLLPDSALLSGAAAIPHTALLVGRIIDGLRAQGVRFITIEASHLVRDGRGRIGVNGVDYLARHIAAALTEE